MNTFRHLVNFALLLSFLTLAVTGVMSFVLPFDLDTARVHIVFGTATLACVAAHLATRLNYFVRLLKPSPKAKPLVGTGSLFAVTAAWAGLLYISVDDRPPVPSLIGLGYEARHRAEIFRPHERTAYKKVAGNLRVARDAAGPFVTVDVDLGPEELPDDLAVAIWTESTIGDLIETLYVDERAAFSDRPDWGGEEVGRHEVLPIWRHKYAAAVGLPVDDGLSTDVVSAATPTHSFSIADYLESADKEFVLCVELNLANDPNETFPDTPVGQPSILYTALFDEFSPAYQLMYLTAHGGGAAANGQLNYDLDSLTTATDLVEKILTHVERAAPSQPEP